MKSFRLLCSLIVLGTGCSGKSDDTGAFAPDEGVWAASSTVVTSDSCGLYADSTLESDPITITVVGASTFIVDTGTGEIECTLSGMDFTCEAVVATNDLSADGIDAIITSTDVPGGSFTSATAGTVVFDQSLECDGADCTAFDFPCSAEITSNIERM